MTRGDHVVRELRSHGIVVPGDVAADVRSEANDDERSSGGVNGCGGDKDNWTRLAAHLQSSWHLLVPTSRALASERREGASAPKHWGVRGREWSSGFCGDTENARKTVIDILECATDCIHTRERGVTLDPPSSLIGHALPAAGGTSDCPSTSTTTWPH